MVVYIPINLDNPAREAQQTALCNQMLADGWRYVGKLHLYDRVPRGLGMISIYDQMKASVTVQVLTNG